MATSRFSRAVKALLGRRRIATSTETVQSPENAPAAKPAKPKPPTVCHDSRGRVLPVKPNPNPDESLIQKVNRLRREIRRVNEWWRKDNL